MGDFSPAAGLGCGSSCDGGSLVSKPSHLTGVWSPRVPILPWWLVLGITVTFEPQVRCYLTHGMVVRSKYANEILLSFVLGM